MISQVNNVIDPFKYTEVPFGSKSELKEYLKVSSKSSRLEQGNTPGRSKAPSAPNVVLNLKNGTKNAMERAKGDCCF